MIKPTSAEIYFMNKKRFETFFTHFKPLKLFEPPKPPKRLKPPKPPKPRSISSQANDLQSHM